MDLSNGYEEVPVSFHSGHSGSPDFPVFQVTFSWLTGFSFVENRKLYINMSTIVAGVPGVTQRL